MGNGATFFFSMAEDAGPVNTLSINSGQKERSFWPELAAGFSGGKG
jgi:hypothetical protein